MCALKHNGAKSTSAIKNALYNRRQGLDDKRRKLMAKMDRKHTSDLYKIHVPKIDKPYQM